MSIILGCLRNRGALIDAEEVRRLCVATKRYGTGVDAVVISDRVGMSVQPVPSHERSLLVTRPMQDRNGNLLAFDGRLDNHQELADLLELDRRQSSDAEIVLGTFARWGEACFSKLIGDWALALWSKSSESLYLARDHAGTRTLYYQRKKDGVFWSTYLDTLCNAEQVPNFSAEYAGHYLASRPLGHLSPYENVFCVRPAHYVTFCGEAPAIERAHWVPRVSQRVVYQKDRDYEERFLSLLERSVERRSGPGAAVIAELSGGMDSSTIVCVSDHLRRAADPTADVLATVSYYDDSEESLNDRPYFSLIEASRGKDGVHVDTAFSRRTFKPQDIRHGRYLIPGADSSYLVQEQIFQDAFWSKGYCGILSGIGGDELLGGVPNAIPELSGYLVSGNVRDLLRQSVAWSVAGRTTLLHTLKETAAYTVKLYSGRTVFKACPPWISSAAIRGSGFARYDLAAGWNVWRAMPTEIDNALTWESLLQSLPHLYQPLLFRPEYRYPFLDRELVEYLLAIPREQLLRPGRRRSLMRRALVGIVPEEILERRRKAFQLAAPLKAIASSQAVIEDLFRDSYLARLELIDPRALLHWVKCTGDGDPIWWQALWKAIALELWLRTTFASAGSHAGSGHGATPLQV